MIDSSYFDNEIDREGTKSEKYCALKEKFGRDDILPAWVADMDLPSSPSIVDALKKRANHPIYGYTSATYELKSAIKKWQLQRHNFEVDCDEIELFYGVVPSIFALISLFTRRDDGVILQPPIYSPFYDAIRENRREILKNPLKRVDSSFEIDIENLKKRANEGAKMILLCNPHNPIGIIHPKETLQKIGEIALKSNLLIVSDEIHSDITYSKAHTPIASISKEIADITITLNSPAKSFNTPGINLSYIIFKNKNLQERFKELKKERRVENFNLFSIEATLLAYKEGDDYIKELNSYLFENIKLTKSFLNTHAPKIDLFLPDATYLVWLGFEKIFSNNSDIFKFLVDDARVGLNMGVEYGEEGSGYARLNIAMPRERLLKILDRIKCAYNNLKSTIEAK